MPTITIEAKGCRSCSLCKDICPTEVFDLDAETGQAMATRPADCIGCTSCEYICPSRCLTVTDSERQKPFHRLDHSANLIARFIQKAPPTEALTDQDLTEGMADVSVRLTALAASVTETMGRGQRAVGRKAGELAAVHLPEMYEQASLADLMDRMKHRFAGAFPFDASIRSEGREIHVQFSNCSIAKLVRAQGETEGTAVLCVLFHEYWAGLVGQFSKRVFAANAGEGGPCSMLLKGRE